MLIKVTIEVMLKHSKSSLKIAPQQSLIWLSALKKTAQKKIALLTFALQYLYAMLHGKNGEDRIYRHVPIISFSANYK